jgi:hypothetical protein
MHQFSSILNNEIKLTIDPRVAREAKALVSIAFRNGPIESVHSGKVCPVCDGKPEYRHITQNEMKSIVKNAVDWMATLLTLRERSPTEYERHIAHGLRYTDRWDEPTSKIGFQGRDLLDEVDE